jgi:hypothetical protein
MPARLAGEFQSRHQVELSEYLNQLFLPCAPRPTPLRRRARCSRRGSFTTIASRLKHSSKLNSAIMRGLDYAELRDEVSKIFRSVLWQRLISRYCRERVSV